jgi:HK97 gp10 family phage protein
MAELVHIAGLKELAAALHELPIAMARKQMAGPVSKGAALIRDEARRLAPVYHGEVSEGHPPPGTLKKAIVMKRERADTKAEVVARFIVAVRSGKKFQHVGKKGTNLDAYYWKFVEFGTSKMAARPFLRPAFEQEKGRALEVIVAGLRRGLEDEATRLAWGRR